MTKKNVILGLISAIVIAILILSFSACSIVAKHCVYFEVDGSVYQSVKTKGEETIDLPADPTKDEYIFDGWYYDKDTWQLPFNADSLANQALKQDLTIYAKWLESDITKRTYEVNFNTLGGNAVTAIKLKYGSELPANIVTTKLGCTFVGWYKDAECQNKWDYATDTVVDHTTLYAKWVDNKYASGCDITSVEGMQLDGTTLTASVPNSQDRFVFADAITVSQYATWILTTDFEGKNILTSKTATLTEGDNSFFITVISGSKANTKQYKVTIRRRVIYTVTYDPNNGTDSAFTQQVEEDSVVAQMQFTKLGYTFATWMNGDAEWQPTAPVKSSMDLVAKWQPNQYTLTLDTNTSITLQPATALYQTPFVVPVPQKAGYTFVGWMLNDELVTNADGESLAPYTLLTDCTLTAKWQIAHYTLTYINTFGATNPNPTTFTVDDKIDLVGITCAGRQFKGWLDNGNLVTTITNCTADLQLTASWDLVEYTATFVAEGEQVGTATFTIESEYILEPQIPTKLGYNAVWGAYEFVASDITITPVYTPIEYAIVYQNAGTHNNVTSYTIETPTFTLQPATKEGYTFNCWLQDGTPITQITLGSAGVKTITASWSTVTYNINYIGLTGDYDVDTPANPNPATYDIETAVELTPASKKGYDFDCWTINGEKVEAIPLGTIGDKTIVANWQPIQYTITYTGLTSDYDIDTPVNTNPTTYTVETQIDLAPASKSGYTFMGWTANGEPVTQIPAKSMGNKTIAANWQEISYQLTFVLDSPDSHTKGYYNSGESNPDHYTASSQITFVTLNCGMYGYTFKGWFDAKVEGNKVDGIAPATISGDKVFYAQWVLEQYTITYLNTPAEGNTNPTTYTVETDTFELVPPSKNAYTFVNWTVFDEQSNTYIPAQTTILNGSHGNLTFYANWAPITYSLTYNLNGGTTPAQANPATYNIESETIVLASPQKLGYTFVGWFDSPIDGNQVTQIEQGSFGDKNLYAIYQIINYTITYHYILNGEQIDSAVVNPNTTTFTVEDAAIFLQDATLDDASFLGWYSDIDLTTKIFGVDTTILANVDVYARFVNFSITYVGLQVGDINPNPSKYSLAFATVELQPATREGWTFIGFFDAPEDGNQIEEIVTQTMQPYTLYVIFQINQYTITFDSDGGTSIDDITQDFATPITQPTNPNKTGYTFLGWFEADSTTAFELTTIPSRNVDLKAKWEAIVYTVQYDMNGADKGANVERYTIDQLPITLIDPTKEGWTFNGWFTDSGMDLDNAVTQIEYIPEYGTITYLYAKLTINQYTFTFDCAGGTEVEPITQNFATVITAPVPPTRTGYDFGGWLQNGNLYTFTTVPSHDVTLTARWVLINYPINYNLNGGLNGTNPATFTIESDSITLQPASKVGYDFVGWFDSNDNGNQVTVIEQGSFGETNLYAIYTPIIYTITYLGTEGATNNNPATYTIESETIGLNNPRKGGYRFMGWLDSAEQPIGQIINGSYGNITLTATWVERDYTVYLNREQGASLSVSFDLNGAEGVAPQTQVLNDNNSLIYPNIPTREGYLFGGWYTNAECTGRAFNFKDTLVSSVTLYARWQLFSGEAAIISASDYLLSGGVSVGSTQLVAVNGKNYNVYMLLPIADGNISIYTTGDLDTFGYLYNTYGNTLAYSDDESSSNKNFKINYNVTAGEIYYVVVRGYSPSTVGNTTLVIDGATKPHDGGVLAASFDRQVLKFNTSFDLPVVAGDNMFTFMGWFTEPNGTGTQITAADGKSIVDWNIDDDVTLYSYLKKREYTVSFSCGRAEDFPTITLAYGDRLDLNLYTPKATGYSFKGWMLDGEEFNADTMPDYDLELVADWMRYSIMGSIKIDENKKEISIHDVFEQDGVKCIDPDLFSVLIFDSDNKEVTNIKATITGSVTVGATNIIIKFQVVGSSTAP